MILFAFIAFIKSLTPDEIRKRIERDRLKYQILLQEQILLRIENEMIIAQTRKDERRLQQLIYQKGKATQSKSDLNDKLKKIG